MWKIDSSTMPLLMTSLVFTDDMSSRIHFEFRLSLDLATLRFVEAPGNTCSYYVLAVEIELGWLQ